MDPVTPGIWSKIPGYDGNSDSDEDEDEVALKATAAERLEQIVEVLGDRYVDVPLIDFHAAPKPRDLKETSASYRTAPPPRTWGPNGPPPCFRIEHTDAVLVREAFLSNGLVPTVDRDWLVQWSGPGMRDYSYQGLHEYQRVNHFPGSSELTRKDRMWQHLLEKAKVFGRETFGFVPETFVLPDQLEQFLECYEKSEYLWIVKPHASSRGRGIFILRDSAELPLDECSVVSRYIENPLLIQDLKWDLRVYVLVTGFEPLRAYTYREGLTRFASSPYSTEEEHLQDAFRHLTNYSINKSAHNFVENREVKHDNVGHKWSLSALLKHLQCVGVDTELMWARIQDLIIKTLLAVEPTICSKTREVAPHHTNCFEVYGFDVLVDEDLKPWLIEVNLSPSMQAESPLDWQVKSALLADAFNLVGICHVDQQTVSTSRLRNRYSQVSHVPPPMRRSSSTGTLRPLSAAVTKSREDKGTEQLWNGLNLDMLTEWQLKMLAHSLKEMGRRHNFIRLYPTKATVRRYAPLTDGRMASGRFRDVRLPTSPDIGRGCSNKLSASQLLASLLFGPTPVRAPPPQPGNNRRTTLMSAHPRRGRGCVRAMPGSIAQDSEATCAVGSMAEPEADPPQSLGTHAPKAANAVGVKCGQRLLFMEYLVRVSSACESLTPSEKAKICQSPSYTRLLRFHRHLKQRQSTQQDQEDGSCSDNDNDGDPELELHGGGLIDDLWHRCRSDLDALAREIWQDEATLQDPPAPPKGFRQKEGSGITTEGFLPPSFAASVSGQKVINGLVCQSAADLERVLSGPQFPDEFRLELTRDPDADVPPNPGHAAGQWKEGPHQSGRRPSSSGPAGRRLRQDRRPMQIQSGPLHDLLRVPRDYVEPAVMVDLPGTYTPGQRRPPKCLPGEDGTVAMQVPPSSGGYSKTPTDKAYIRASPSPEYRGLFSRSPPPGPRGGPECSRRLSASPPPRHGSGPSATLRPMSAFLRAGGARPPSAAGKVRQSPAQSPANAAERASGVLARAVVAQAVRSDPPLKVPMQLVRSAPTLPDAMTEAFTPLRLRSSNCMKMRTTAAPPLPFPEKGARLGAVDLLQKASLQQGSFMHAPHFNMDIEL